MLRGSCIYQDIIISVSLVEEVFLHVRYRSKMHQISGYWEFHKIIAVCRHFTPHIDSIEFLEYYKLYND